MAMTPQQFRARVTRGVHRLASMAEARMLSTVMVERPGAKVTDRATGKVTREFTTIYAGKAKVHQFTAGQATITGANVTVGSSAVHLPIGSPDAVLIRRGDRVTVTSDPDPRYVGMVAWIDGPFAKDEATARRFPVTFTEVPA